MDPDMVLGNSLGSDVSMTLVGTADHPDWHGPSSGMAPKASIYPGGSPDPRYPLSL